MRKILCFIILIVLMLGITTSSWAQEPNEKTPIVAEKRLLGCLTGMLYKYTYQGKNIEKTYMGLSLSKFKTIVRDCPDALAEVETAEKYLIPVAILGLVSGGLIGYPIGQAIKQDKYPWAEDPNWTLACVGVGFAIVGLRLEIACGKRLKKAVDIYNSSIGQSSGTRFLDLELVFAPNRINILLRF